MKTLAGPQFAGRIESVRKFNRFYTQQIGVLNESLLDSPFSLAEARVIYELAHREQTTATELSKELGLDAGYLSRILRAFRQKGLIEKTPSKEDARQTLLSLSDKGQKAFSNLNSRSREQVSELLSQLSQEEQNRLVSAMDSVEDLLGAPPEHKTP